MRRYVFWLESGFLIRTFEAADLATRYARRIGALRVEEIKPMKVGA